MSNKCSECGAMLAAGQTPCPYCGSEQTDDSDEALLGELMGVKRKYELAAARGELMTVNELLADEFTSTLIDGDEPQTMDKKSFMESGWTDKNLFSYSYSKEMLLARTDEAAQVSCIDTFCRHYPKGNILYPDGESNSYARTKINFVRRSRRWQIALINTTSIDEEGNNC